MIGIDIIDIARIRRLMTRPAFLKKVYTQGEIAYFRAGGENAQTLAGMFAVKEAAAKALGTGVCFGFKDIEVTHNELGAPKVLFHGEALQLFKMRGFVHAEISLSHTNEYCAAVCLMLPSM